MPFCKHTDVKAHRGAQAIAAQPSPQHQCAQQNHHHHSW
jgi:hypothetical protein